MTEQLKQELTVLKQARDHLYACLTCLDRLVVDRETAVEACCSHLRVNFEHHWDGHKNQRIYTCLECHTQLDSIPVAAEVTHTYT